MNEIETTTRMQEDLSSLSASWTGNSQFYIPQQRPVVFPPQEQGSSVSEWLDQLPAEPDGFEKAEKDASDDEEVMPLSPYVEIERGRMRKKMRSSEGRKRRRSLTEEDMYPS